MTVLPRRLYDWGNMPISYRDAEVLKQTDGHFCWEWDGLAVSAWTQEYDSCICFRKSRLGRVINQICAWRFNFGWWLHVGLLDWIRGDNRDEELP